ncbi:MAG: metallophosphoesterase [Solirubrobacterales bacterium]|nr:metallophosphoesterase [Solirubrobacterales bacterium]
MFGSGKGRRRRALRIFFATDVHGSERCFRKFLAAARVYEADALVLGGDIAGKGLVPVVGVNGSLHAEVRGEPVTVPATDGERLSDEINRLGFYPVRLESDEVAVLEQDPAAVDRLFREEIVKQVERWCALAQERLAPEVRCIITPGNDDPLEIDPVLRAADRIECPEAELCELGPVVMASLGDVTPTPWNTEREYEEEELGERIAAIMDQVPPGRPSIVNFHCPPYSSGLDTAPELDATLKPVIRGGRPSFVPVGSHAVREAIKRYGPVVGLHGHIHESRGAQMIGKTLCLNPGSDYTADLLRGAVVDIAEDGSYLDFLLTAG